MALSSSHETPVGVFGIVLVVMLIVGVVLILKGRR